MNKFLLIAALAIFASPAHAGQQRVTSYVTNIATTHGDTVQSVEYMESEGYYWVMIKGGAAYNQMSYHHQKNYLKKYCKNSGSVSTFGISVNGKYHELCQ